MCGFVWEMYFCTVFGVLCVREYEVGVLLCHNEQRQCALITVANVYTFEVTNDILKREPHCELKFNPVYLFTLLLSLSSARGPTFLHTLT